MKKAFIITIILLLIVIIHTGCTNRSYDNAETKKESYAGGYFTEIKEWDDDWYIVYANDTKVMYIIHSEYRSYGIAPLYNSDGSLQVYTGED